MDCGGSRDSIKQQKEDKASRADSQDLALSFLIEWLLNLFSHLRKRNINNILPNTLPGFL